MYTSTERLKRTPVLDKFEKEDMNPEGFGKGYVGRDYGAEPLGFARPQFPQEFYVPSNEWIERIEDLDANKAQVIDHRWERGFKSLDQGSTNYCWCAGPTGGYHYLRAMAGLPHVDMSTAAVAAVVKNYRNVGAWAGDALQYMEKYGSVPQSLWPQAAIDRKYDTDQVRRTRDQYKVLESFDLPDKSFHALVSSLLRGFPTTVGYQYWSHLVLAVGLTVHGSDPESDVGVIIQNSWSDNWKDRGTAVLMREKATPDEAIAMRQVTPSEGE